MQRDDPANDPLVSLAESFVQRYRGGERLTVEQFAAQHPELADRIRDIFPALLVMEDLAAAPCASQDPGELLETAEPPQYIGDYRIVREIGRGGMGIVFEAEQVALGRAVALKVLTRRLSLDARALERFRAEARSAGRLHHPRIVPVHDVGRAEDFYYYTMQLIAGQGLDVVLSEIQRVRGNSGSRAGSGSSNVPARTSETVQALARTMLSGEFSGPVPSEATTAANASMLGHRRLSPGHPPQSSLSVAKRDARHYHRRVAHIGQQVAESLQYAHSQGVLHRDIKPSNLLLDAEGNIWVTDFGLAKAVDSATASDGGGMSGSRLTDTGDVVGTVRYMAPERFRGWSDPRSDVYALGVTLYELLTLHPAFDESDRLMLIQNIRDIEPRRPRAFDPAIPFDLETIVLKAIQKEPSRRYQTAGELGGDLRKFLEYRPIAARRTTRAERLAQWARRNPSLAAALAGVAGLLMTVAVGTSLLSWRLNRALHTSETLLRQSLLDQARSARSSSILGGRTLALDALRKAAAIEPGLDLRNEAVAAMARTDIHPTPERTLPPARAAVVFGGHLEYSLADDGEGVAFVRDAVGKELQQFPVGLLWDALASPDNRFLIVKDGINRSVVGPERIRVFEWRSGRQILHLDGGGDFDFHPSGKGFVIANNASAGEVVFYDLPHGTKVRQFQPSRSVVLPKYHPAGNYLAFLEQGTPTLSRLDLQSGEVTHLGAKTPAGLVGSISFNASGTRVAAGASNWRTYVWDTDTGDLTATLSGHEAEVVRTAFIPNSDLLATSGWDHAIRLWDVIERRTLARINAETLVGVSRDGSRLGYQSGNQTSIVRITPALEFRSLRGHSGKNPRSCCFAPDGQTLVSCGNDGFLIWDNRAGKCLATIDQKGTLSAEFTAAGDSLITAAAAGLYRWPVRHFADHWEVGPPVALFEEKAIERHAAMSPEQDSLVVASDATNRLEIVSLTNGERRRIPCGPVPSDCRYSPDGSWIVASAWRGRWWAAYDAHTSHLMQRRNAKIRQCCFSPDSQRLVFATESGGEVWSTATWKIVKKLPHDSGGIQWGSILSFSPDGAVLAVGGANGVVRLLDAQDYHELARLESPAPQSIHDVVFDADGGRLAVCTNGAVNVWNLRSIRAALCEMKLDWAQPPLPPAAKASAPVPPLVIHGGPFGVR